MQTTINALFAIILFSTISCEKDEPRNTLSASTEKIEIPAEGRTSSFTIETNAESWSIETPDTDWFDIPITSGSKKEALISIRVTTKTLIARTIQLLLQQEMPNRCM